METNNDVLEHLATVKSTVETKWLIALLGLGPGLFAGFVIYATIGNSFTTVIAATLGTLVFWNLSSLSLNGFFLFVDVERQAKGADVSGFNYWKVLNASRFTDNPISFEANVAVNGLKLAGLVIFSSLLALFF